MTFDVRSDAVKRHSGEADTGALQWLGGALSAHGLVAAPLEWTVLVLFAAVRLRPPKSIFSAFALLDGLCKAAGEEAALVDAPSLPLLLVVRELTDSSSNAGFGEGEW